MTLRTARGALLLAVLMYVGVIAWFTPLVVQDYPNHLARALVMEDLIFHHGAQFGTTYQYHFLFTPYVLGDLILAALTAVFGISVAGGVWAVLTFLSLPLSLLAYLRARETSPDVTVLMLFISLYLSTDTFFIMGFTEFRLSVAVVFVALALVERLRKRWSWMGYVAFVGVVIASYLTHLAATVFIGAAVGASGAWRLMLRQSRIAWELLLIAPVVAMIAWHELVAVNYRLPTDLLNQFFVYGTPRTKFFHLYWDFLRFNIYQELVVLVLLVAVLGFALRDRLFRDERVRRGPQVLEPWAYAAVFLVLYVALPFAQSEASYVDVRTLALLPVFLILGLLNLPRRATSTGTAVLVLAIALVTANLALLSFHFHKSSVRLAKYRAVVAKIPEGSEVLPIFTGVRLRYLYIDLHAASYAVIDRHAEIPYLFSGDVGSPMKYFRYVHRPYAPTEFWYSEDRDPTVDWQRIRNTYQYALIMKPFTPTRIPLQGRVVAQNDTAELLALDAAAR
jgi:hypothetical protein